MAQVTEEAVKALAEFEADLDRIKSDASEAKKRLVKAAADEAEKAKSDALAKAQELANGRERARYVQYTRLRPGRVPGLLEVYYRRNIAWNLKIALKANALERGYDETMTYIDRHTEELAGRRDLIARVLSSKALQEAPALL